MKRAIVVCPALAMLVLDSATPGTASPPRAAPPAVTIHAPDGEPTRILDRETADRLLRNKGLTLQWIDWNRRGIAYVANEGGVWKLRGAQAEAGGPGRLFLDGTIAEIGNGHFTFEGTIRIADTPDRGRQCERTKSWHFAVTQNRPYFRLREFEWCDGLTDYIDIYF